MLLAARKWQLRRFKGIKIGPRTVISLSACLLCQARNSICIGEDSLVAFKALIFTVSAKDGIERPVVIGSRTFIGGGTVIGPGVIIGDDCIVGAGSVVLASVPAGSLVIGNPAVIIRSGLTVHRARDEFLFS